MTDRTPKTAAGRALEQRLAYDRDPAHYEPGDFFIDDRRDILAIEAEVREDPVDWHPVDWHGDLRYARLFDLPDGPAPLDVERLYDALAHWYDGADGGESFRLVPMSSDGGVMPTGDLHPFAAAIAREYAKDPQP